ncbi:MAG: universal stress protein [Chthoniobacterales bacterium]
MYKKILVALDNSPTDRAMFPHITELARLHRSELLLVHIADGWAARNYTRFELADSEEMKADRDYLAQMVTDLSAQGLEVKAELGLGDPAIEILKIAEAQKCDLIAMTTHGHRFLNDLIYGSTITQVRHQAKVPLLLVNAAK